MAVRSFLGSHSEICIGSRLGKYHIQSIIGQGGMGVVYLAEDTHLERIVALKVLSARLLSDDSFLEQLRKEAKIVASFAHPNVVHVNAFDVVDGVALIEMENIDGGSLSNRLRTNVVTPHEIVRYAHDIANALAYCHERGAIHRDIKPSNILIDNHERARLADFGIAKAIASSERGALTSSWSGLFQGTPSYAPPEAWEGAEPAVTWDIYSLGVVLYESLSGSLPFIAGTPLELVRKMVATSIEPIQRRNPNVSDSLADLIDAMLTTDVNRRVQDAESVVAQIIESPEWLRGSDSESATIAVPRPKRKRIRWNRVLRKTGIGIAALLALLSVTALAGWMTRSSGPRGLGAVEHEVPAPIQEDNAQGAMDSVENLLATNKGTIGTNTAVLNAWLHGDGLHRPEQWMVVFDGDDIREIVAYSESSVARYEVTRIAESDAYKLEGGWSGYHDASHTVLRFGRARGNLRVRSNPLNLVGSLSHLADQDGSITKFAISAAPPREPITDARFIADLEAMDALQPLLYRELLPRSLPWAAAVEGLFPSFIDGTLAVPLFPVGPEVELDKLASQLKNGSPSLGLELGDGLTGVPRSTGALLHVVSDGNALFMTVSCPLFQSDNKLFLEVQLAERFRIPISASPTKFLRYSVDKNQLEAHSGFGTEDTNPPLVVSDRSDAMLTLAVRIPWRDRISSGDRVRMNAVLYQEDTAGNKEVLTRWGFPDTEQIWHGTVLRFETEGGGG